MVAFYEEADWGVSFDEVFGQDFGCVTSLGKDFFEDIGVLPFFNLRFVEFDQVFDFVFRKMFEFNGFLGVDLGVFVVGRSVSHSFLPAGRFLN